MTLRFLVLTIGLAASQLPAQEDLTARPIRAERTHDFDVLH